MMEILDGGRWMDWSAARFTSDQPLLPSFQLWGLRLRRDREGVREPNSRVWRNGWSPTQCTDENGPMKPSGLGWTVRCLLAVRSFTRERAVAGRMMRVAEQGTGQLLFTLRGEAGWTRKQPTGLLPASQVEATGLAYWDYGMTGSDSC